MSDAYRRVDVRTGQPYTVTIGSRALEGAQAFLADRGGPGVVLTDANVAPLYLERLGIDAPAIVVPAGEEAKSFQQLERVLDSMAGAELDRSSCLVALGGGAIGDLGGLAASLYMRGVDVIQLPTTLLSQVDSSVGGKTAINLAAGKNLAGTFHQPAAVFADVDTLATLSDEEFRSGLGEVVKSALIGDAELFELLEREPNRVLGREQKVLSEVVERSVRVKAAVVEADEHEAGERKKLNLGHTFGHAIEHVAGYGKIPHGIAVATGLNLAIEAGVRTDRLADPDLPARLHELLSTLGLFPLLGDLRRRYGVDLEATALEEAMRLDKKGSAGRPRFVLVEGIGSVPVDCDLGSDVLHVLFR